MIHAVQSLIHAVILMHEIELIQEHYILNNGVGSRHHKLGYMHLKDLQEGF